jgi:hypothetical protein
MQSISRFVLFILAGLVVFSAGCMQGTGTVPTVSPADVSPVRDLALNPADLPACFSLTEQYEKGPGDVGMLAKDFGWQAGYVVSYTCPSDGREPNVITHSLAVYPAENISAIAFLVDEQDRMGLSYENFSFTDQRTAMRGFFGNAGGAPGPYVSPDTIISGGLPTDNGLSAKPRSLIAEIIFYRGTQLEILRMTGPGTNITFLRGLARIAEQKIP